MSRARADVRREALTLIARARAAALVVPTVAEERRIVEAIVAGERADVLADIVILAVFLVDREADREAES